MKITQLTVENFMRITAANIKPDGTVVILTGKNKAGKSAIFNAIRCAFSGKGSLPARALHDGAKSGQVIVKMDGDPERDIPPLTITLKIKSDGTTGVCVEAAGGYRPASPQTLLNTFYSAVTFDPLAFSRMDSAAQVTMLRELVGLDFTDLDQRRSAAYDKRRDLNRDLKQAQGMLANLADYVADVPDPVSVAGLVGELEAGEGVNAENATVRGEAGKAAECAQSCAKDVDSLTDQLKVARERLFDAEHAAVQLADRERSLEEVDTQSIRNRITAADASNNAIRRSREHNEQRSDVESTILKLAGDGSDLTERIGAIDEEKQTAMAAVDWPVDGLGFDDDGVTLNGLPFAQASSGEDIDVSVAMGFAMNPALGVILIRDASLLDADTKARIIARAEEADGQVWMEIVDADEPCAIVIEDGHVRDVSP